MNRSTIALAVGGVVAVVAAGVAGAFVLGIVPGGGDGAPPLNESSGNNSTQAFAFEVNETSKCGQKCREMAITVANTADETAENVSMDFDVYAGESDPVWEGRERVGTMEAGASESMTLRITVDDDGYNQIVSNLGSVTLQTTVTSENASNSFEDERNVG